MTISYYLVLVGFGSGFTGLAFVYLTDIFYETGKLRLEPKISTVKFISVHVAKNSVEVVGTRLL